MPYMKNRNTELLKEHFSNLGITLTTRCVYAIHMAVFGVDTQLSDIANWVMSDDGARRTPNLGRVSLLQLEREFIKSLPQSSSVKQRNRSSAKSAQCCDCAFFDVSSTSMAGGICRRHVPRPILGVQGIQHHTGDYCCPTWPQVMPFDFCGDFVMSLGVNLLPET